MKKMRLVTPLLLSALLLFAALITACSDDTPADTSGTDNTTVTETVTVPVTTEEPEPVLPVIHSISDLNLTGETDDHAEENIRSASLELNFREKLILDEDKLNIKNAQYARLRLLADGRYMLTFQEGKGAGAGTVYYCLGDSISDFKSPKRLFWPTKDATGTFEYRYTTCDLVVLQNGDILAFSTFTNTKSYANYVEGNGIAMRRSSDNGKTWSDVSVVYVGTNWEPNAVQLRSGEIHLYFTHTAPMIYKYGFNSERRSSGAGLIRSYDNGATWTPFVTGAPFEAQRVMQQYILTLGGVRHYTDQMPVGVELHNGTIVLACESYQADKSYTISLGYSPDNWSTWLGEDEPGPAERKNSIAKNSAGPYINQFPSGETLLSYNSSSKLKFQLGNSEATAFGGAYTVFPETGYWGCSLIDMPHRAVAVFPDINSTVGTGTIVLGNTYLNHSIYPQRMTPEIDGANFEWEANTDALFVGSQTQAQATLRVAYDDDNIYFLAERLDYFLEDNDAVRILLDGKDGSYALEVSVDGKLRMYKVVLSNQTEVEFSGISCSVYTEGTLNESNDKDVGAIYEVSVPRSYFDIEDNAFQLAFTLYNADNGEKVVVDEMGFASAMVKAMWTNVYLK